MRNKDTISITVDTSKFKTGHRSFRNAVLGDRRLKRLKTRANRFRKEME